MGVDGQTFVTMDDIADGEMMRKEDEDEEAGSSEGDETDDEDEDEEENAVVNAEEVPLIAEAGNAEGVVRLDGDDESEDDEEDKDDVDEDDEWQSLRSGFQAQLERVRSLARGKRPMDVRRVSFEDEDDDDDLILFERNLSWAEEDEDFIVHTIQVYLSPLITKNCV
jgi:hypothetical protein